MTHADTSCTAQVPEFWPWPKFGNSFFAWNAQPS